MPIIYRMAVKVCIWLGTGDNESRQAIAFIDQILDLRNLEMLVKNSGNSGNWTSLLSLIARPWFSRRWVVQEIAVSKDAEVFCGTETVSWSKLSDAISLLEIYYDVLFDQSPGTWNLIQYSRNKSIRPLHRLEVSYMR